MTDPTPLSPAEQLAEWAELVENTWNRCRTIGHQGEEFMWNSDFECAATQIRDEVNRWSRPAPAPPEGELTDEELLRTYGQARRDHCYEGPSDDWPKRAERAATIAGLRAVEAAVIARRPAPAPQVEGEVAELVLDLNLEVDAFDAGESSLCWLRRSDLVRITELLQQQQRHIDPPAEGEVEK